MIRITSHAVERYIARVEPGLAYDEAMHRLTEMAVHASRIRDRTHRGQELYVYGNVVFICKRDKGVTDPVAVTVGRWEPEPEPELAAPCTEVEGPAVTELRMKIEYTERCMDALHPNDKQSREALGKKLAKLRSRFDDAWAQDICGRR